MKKIPSKNDVKKKGDFLKLRPVKPGPPQAPTNTYKSTRHIRPLKKTHMSWQRRVQRRVQRGACREKALEHSTRLGRPRARSGYIRPMCPSGFLGNASPGTGSEIRRQPATRRYVDI